MSKTVFKMAKKRGRRMLRIYFDNGEQLNIKNDLSDILDIIKEMRNNNKKNIYLMMIKTV